MQIARESNVTSTDTAGRANSVLLRYANGCTALDRVRLREVLDHSGSRPRPQRAECDQKRRADARQIAASTEHFAGGGLGKADQLPASRRCQSAHQVTNESVLNKEALFRIASQRRHAKQQA